MQRKPSAQLARDDSHILLKQVSSGCTKTLVDRNGDVVPSDDGCEYCNDDPSAKEVVNTINFFKNNKLAGAEDVPTEIYNHAAEVNVLWLESISGNV